MTRQAKASLVILSAAVLLVVIVAVSVYPLIRNVYSSNKQTEADYAHAVQTQTDAQVPSGFLVHKVTLLSAASLAGLQPGDIITRYNNLPVTSTRSYYTAIDRVLADNATSVTLTVMRAGKPIQLTVPPGLLGFEGETWSPFTDRIFDLLGKDRIDDAASILAKAGPAVPEEQRVMAQIALLPEKDSAQNERRKELMGRLMPSETDFDHLGVKSMDVRRYKAAQMFLSKAIEVDPDDISARENLAASYQRAGQFEEAGRLVDDIVANHSAEMSDYGWHVLLSTRAEVYENRKDYPAAAADFRKAMELLPDDDDTTLRLGYLLALAKMKNLQRFEDGVAFCNKYPTKTYSARPFDVDALRAYLLVGNHEETKARATVEKWRKDSDARKSFQYYWGDVSDASDVVDTWNRLMK